MTEDKKSIDLKPDAKPEKKAPVAPVKKPSEKSANPEKAGKYVVVSVIKEDGKKFLPGEDYTGCWAVRYLEHGQIRKKD